MNDYSRKPVQLVKLIFPACANNFQFSPCAANSLLPVCFYTYPTCVDKPHFVLGSHTVKFCSGAWKGAAGAIANTLLQGLMSWSNKLDYKNMRLEFGEVTITLADDKPEPFANPSKAFSRREIGGTLLRNLFARNPNWYHIPVEIYEGDASDAENDLEFIYAGVLEKVTFSEKGTCQLSVKDLLADSNTDSHPEAGDECALVAAYSGGATATVYYGNELADFGIVRSEDGKYFKFTSKSDLDENNITTLSGCAFVFGCSGTIAISAKVSSVIVNEVDGGYAVGDSRNSGFPADLVALDLLWRAGIDLASRLTWEDNAVTLTGAINSSATTVPLSDSSRFPSQGLIKIGDEMILYDGKNGNNLLIASVSMPLWAGHLRGSFSSIAASHNQGDAVYLAQASAEVATNLVGYPLKREVRSPQQVRDLLNDFVNSTMCWFVQSSALLKMVTLAPPTLVNLLPLWRDRSEILAGSTSVVDDQAERDTQVQVHYLPNAGEDSPGNSRDSYQCHYIYVDAVRESPNWYNGPTPRVIGAPYLFRQNEAQALAVRIHNRCADGMITVKASTSWREDAYPGQFVRITTKKMQGPDGNPYEKRICQVVSRQGRTGKNDYELVDMRMVRRYARIAPAYPTLYEAITDASSTIKVLTAADSFVDTDLESSDGVVCVGGVYYRYSGITSQPARPGFDLTGCSHVHPADRQSSEPYAQNAGAYIIPQHCAKTDESKDKWASIGDARNRLSSTPDQFIAGEKNEDGYYLW